MYSSAKTFYNHKPCTHRHENLRRSNLDEVMDLLCQLGLLVNGALVARRSRSDLHGHHEHAQDQGSLTPSSTEDEGHDQDQDQDKDKEKEKEKEKKKENQYEEDKMSSTTQRSVSSDEEREPVVTYTDDVKVPEAVPQAQNEGVPEDLLFSPSSFNMLEEWQIDETPSTEEETSPQPSGLGMIHYPNNEHMSDP